MEKVAKSIEGCFVVSGTIEETDRLKTALTRLPRSCFDQIDFEHSNHLTGEEDGSVFLKMHGNFLVPDEAKAVVVEANPAIGSKVRFLYGGFKYSVYCER